MLNSIIVQQFNNNWPLERSNVWVLITQTTRRTCCVEQTVLKINYVFVLGNKLLNY